MFYNGTLVPELATQIVPGRETLTAISARTNSLAAINGGYFVIEEWPVRTWWRKKL